MSHAGAPCSEPRPVHALQPPSAPGTFPDDPHIFVMCWKCKPGQLRSFNWHQVDALYEQERFQDALNEGPAAALLFIKVFKYFIAAVAISATLGYFAPQIRDAVLYETIHGEKPPVVVHIERHPPTNFQ